MTSDPVARLRSADPARTVFRHDAAAATRLLDRAVAAAAPSSSARRRSRVFTAGLGAALLLGGGGAAYAVLNQPTSTSLILACAAGTTQQQFTRAGGELTSVMDVSSGDPVADCAAEYERLDGAAPALVGYSTGRRFLSVVPATWPVPSSWKPLGRGFRSDAARLELRQRLGDVLDGPEAQCRSADEVQDMVERDLADLEFTGWKIERREQADKADGEDWCAIAFVDDEGQPLVWIQGLEGPANPEVSAQEPIGQLVRVLRRDVVQQCLTLQEARRRTENAVRTAGFNRSDAKIIAIEDIAATCTRAEAPIAGMIEVVLRGPSS